MHVCILVDFRTGCDISNPTKGEYEFTWRIRRWNLSDDKPANILFQLQPKEKAYGNTDKKYGEKSRCR